MMFKRFLARFTVLLLLIVFLSCGENIIDDKSGNTIIDATPPVVSFTLPESNSITSSIDFAISAEFSEPMDASTITDSTFTLTAGIANITGTVIYDGSTATFKPSDSLSYSTAYTAGISTGVKDLAGNYMAEDYTWHFTTGQEPDTELPSAPANVIANVVSPNRIELTWEASTDNIGVTGYTVYEFIEDYTELTPDFQPLITNLTSISYSIDVFWGNPYRCYTVSAVDTSGNESAINNVPCVTLPITTFGGPSNKDVAYSIRQTTDGGYIIVGITVSNTSDMDGIYLIKIDSSGGLEWQKVLIDSSCGTGNSIEQTTDGGFIIGGTGGNDNNEMCLIKTDNAGNIEFEKTYGGIYSDIGNTAKQTADGGYIITGYKGNTPAVPHIGGGVPGDLYLVKTDASGNIIWEDIFGGDGRDEGWSVEQTADGGFIVMGWSSSFEENGIYLIKTDTMGQKEWEKVHPNAGAYSLDLTSDGGYIMAGWKTSIEDGFEDVYLLKTDSMGEMDWERTFSGIRNKFGYSVQSVQQTKDGGYIIAGKDYERSNAFFIKTDFVGELEWERTYGGYLSNEWAYSAQQTTDGGYIMAGSTNFGDVNIQYDNDDIYIVKTDANGYVQW